MESCINAWLNLSEHKWFTLSERYSSRNLTPSNANIMLFGYYSKDTTEINYYIYASNGERDDDGTDKNKDKGLGARVRVTLLDDFKFGASYYRVKNEADYPGRENLIGFDIELNLFEQLKFETEYVMDEFEKRDNRFAYYGRLTGYIEKFSPFISYDYAKDDGNILYKKGLSRYSIGSSYTLSDTVTVKAEYHYHKFDNKERIPVLPSGSDTTNMFKSAIIFVF